LTFSNFQIKLWVEIDNKEVWSNFWFKQFNIHEKIAIWNRLKFPQKYWEILHEEHPGLDFSPIEDLFYIKKEEPVEIVKIVHSSDSYEDSDPKPSLGKISRIFLNCQ